METDRDIPSTAQDRPGWFARWWRALFAAGLTVFFTASIPTDGLPVFVLAVAFALDTVTELVMVRRGRHFTSPRDAVRFALLNALSAVIVLSAVTAYLLAVTDQNFWLIIGAAIAALNTAGLHFALTHPLQLLPVAPTNEQPHEDVDLDR